MKKRFLTTVSSLALVSTASAADLPRLPTKAPAAAAVAAWSWQGFYVGINGGVAWHKATVNAIDNIDQTDSGKISTIGGAFGGHLGYNWQAQNIVFGVEADTSWIDGDGSGTTENFPAFGDWSTKFSRLTTVRGRVGVTFSPTMVYLTGGYAAGKVENSLPNLFAGFPTKSETRSGWTIGGGIEHMLTPNWLVRGEVLYVDLGDTTVQGFFGSGYTARFANKATLARAGVSLKW